MRNHVTALWTVVFQLLVAVNGQSLPYNPTTILYPQFSTSNKNIAYVFLPSSGDAQRFVSLNISSYLAQDTLQLNTLTSNLPFVANDSVAFTPVIAHNGDISVYTGSCSTSTSSALWRFTPSNMSAVGNGTWTQEITTTASDVTAATLPGADFLSRGFSFSTIVEANVSQTEIYLFGGMCPTNATTSSNWQSAASYSNHMLRLSPDSSTAQTTYTLDGTSSREPPVAEAGFTITGLSPSYSNATGIETQQQSFVMVGGHTQTAFINMSEIAVWSLPEETWSFVTVDSPSSSSANTELSIKSTVTSVDSRSGHSAVLSEDGSSIIIYGGWVGDITQAANPQIAILELGSGYGGTGDWKWSVPASQPTGDGMFGHGAVMLPGNVMMILGGYNITSSSNLKRATPAGSQIMFYNVTSMEWITTYTNPAYLAFLDQLAANQGSSISKKKKIGLGLGIGLGLIAVIAAIIVCWRYNRRQQKKRERKREKSVSDLSAGVASFYANPNQEMTDSGTFPWSNRGWNGRQDSNSAVAGYENLQSGVHGLGGAIPPPPPKVSRKALHSRSARGAYQATSAFDFNVGAGSSGRANSLGTAGPIHPIYEADEDEPMYDEEEEVGIALGEPGPSSAPQNSEFNRYSDPFKDPQSANYSSHIRTHSLVSEPESPAASREREIQEWVTDWAAADLLLHAQTRSHSHVGRISPTRRAQIIAATSVSSVSGEEDSGRTESNLSERTDRSAAVSGISRSGSSSQSQGRSRSNSLRGFISGMNPFASTNTSTVGTSTVMSPVFEGPTPKSYVPPRSAGSSSSKSFNTARTSFPALQAEGETLLPRPQGDDISSGEASPARSAPRDEAPGSPSKSKPSAIALGRKRGQAGWLGSLRRVFISDADESSGHASPEHLGFRSGENSPTRVDQTGSPPRRAASAGATLWRRKQGRGDWDDSEDIFGSGSGSGGRSNTFTGGDLSSPGFKDVERGVAGDEEDWDVERAVQNRVVQVMFTVPKEKLRVVNHDFDEDGSVISGNSLKSKKGSGKRSLKDLFIVPPVRSDSEQAGAPRSPGFERTKEGYQSINPDPGEQEEQGQDQYYEPMPSPSPEPESEGKDKEKETQVAPDTASVSDGRSSPSRKKNTKVLEMVDKMEGRASPERS